MKAILDAGVLVAIERRDRRVGAMLRVLQQRRIPLRTSAGVVAQVWRDGARQARLAQALGGVGVRSLSPGDARLAGELQAASRTDDVVDAHVALLAEADDQVITGDPEDLARLLDVRRVRARLVPI